MNKILYYKLLISIFVIAITLNITIVSLYLISIKHFFFFFISFIMYDIILAIMIIDYKTIINNIRVIK